MTQENQKAHAEMHGTMPKASMRNMEGYGCGDSNVTARRENYCSELQNVMEAVVERENMFACGLVSILDRILEFQCGS